MAAEAERIADTRGWLSKAREDLRAGDTLLAAAEPLTGAAAFHAQQAAEKSLKALLYWHDVPFHKTHELEELGRTCLELAPGLEDAVDAAVELTPFAWRFRYPGEPLEPTAAEVVDALERATVVYEAILERLPAEARPH